MRVVLLADRDAVEPTDPQLLKLHGRSSDDNAHVAAALRALGHEVVPMVFDDDLQAMLARLRAARPHVVFNSTDGVGDDRTQAANIAAFLDLAGFPYTGSGAFALALTTDKALSKHLLASHGVPVPPFFTVAPGELPPRGAELPLFVKPLFGGAKECVSLQSLAATRAAVRRRVEVVHRTARQPAICERYIDGRELTVAVLETARGLRVFPVREMVFGGSNGTGPRFATHRVMEDRRYRRRWNVTMENARLTGEQEEAIRDAARTSFRILGLRGYGRLDLRLGPDGAPYVLEVNANPALRPATHSFLAPWPGIEYPELIAQVLAAAANPIERASTQWKRRRNTMATSSSDQKKIVSDIARATKVDPESVAAVLDHLGLGRIIGEASKAGKVSAKNLRIGVRLGKNTIAV